jgi:hypothetical protein
MKRYIISSNNFNGEVHVVYGLDSKLVLIDFIHADLNENQTQVFKERCPVVFTDQKELIAAFKAKGELKVVEQGLTITFDMFWNDYSLKRNRDRCEKFWSKLSEAEQVEAWAGVKPYQRHLALNTWKTKADPDTYLRNKYYRNDYKQ